MLLRSLSQSRDSIHPVNHLGTHLDNHPLNPQHRFSQYHGNRMEVIAVLGFFPEYCCSYWIFTSVQYPGNFSLTLCLLLNLNVLLDLQIQLGLLDALLHFLSLANCLADSV